MIAMRKGKIKDYKTQRVGDMFIIECWVCSGTCVGELLSNGHTRKTQDPELFKRLTEAKRKRLEDAEGLF